MDREVRGFIKSVICQTMGTLALGGKVKERFDFSEPMAENIFRALEDAEKFGLEETKKKYLKILIEDIEHLGKKLHRRAR